MLLVHEVDDKIDEEMVVTLLITDAMLQTVVDEVVEVELLVDVVDDD